MAEKEEAVKQVNFALFRFWRELMPRKSQKNMAFRAETYSGGRKMGVSGKKEAAGLQMGRCSSLFTPKSMARSLSQRRI